MTTIGFRFLTAYDEQEDSALSRLDVLLGAALIQESFFKAAFRERFIALVQALLSRGLPVRIPKRFRVYRCAA